jgi:hypothetical protein
MRQVEAYMILLTFASYPYLYGFSKTMNSEFCTRLGAIKYTFFEFIVNMVFLFWAACCFLNHQQMIKTGRHLYLIICASCFGVVAINGITHNYS